MLVVVDSNVLVSASELRAGSFPFRVLMAASLGPHQLLVSPALQREWRRVLKKPAVAARHRMSAAAQAGFLGALLAEAVIDVPPGAARSCPDPRDQMLWDLLESNDTAVLVTGEHSLLASNDFPGRILSAREFAERYLEPEAT